MGAYWDQLQSLSPLLLWKLGEASGAVATDDSGNGRNGVISNLEVDEYGRTSLINSEPTDTSMGFNANNEHVKIASTGHDGWMDQPSFTYVVTARLENNANSVRWIGGRAQIFRLKYTAGTGMSTRRVSFEAVISGTLRTLNADLSYPNNTDPVHLMAAYDGTNMMLWVNGVKYTANWPGSIAVSTLSGRDIFVGGEGPLSAVGQITGQGVAYYGIAFTDQQATDTYNAFNAPPNQGPSTPTWSLASPDGDPSGKTFDAQMQIGANSVDPEGDDIEYLWEFSQDGGATWHMFGDDTQAGQWGLPGQNSVTWNTTIYGWGTTYRARVKARDVPVGAESAWLESGDFTISHPGEQPVTPALALVHATDFSALFTLSYSSPIGAAWHRTRWRAAFLAGDITAPAWDSGYVAVAESPAWLTSLPFGQAMKFQVQVMDFGGNVSEWSNVVDVMTSRVRTAVDRHNVRNLGAVDPLARYIQWASSIPIGNATETGDAPEIGIRLSDVFPGVPGYAARFGMSVANTGTSLAVANNDTRLQIGLEDEASWPKGGMVELTHFPALNAPPWSIFAVFAPFYTETNFDTPAHMELMGVPGGFWVVVTSGGGIGVHALNNGQDVLGVPFWGGANMGEVNAFSMAYESHASYGIAAVGEPPCKVVVDRVEMRAQAGLNGQWNALWQVSDHTADNNSGCPPLSQPSSIGVGALSNGGFQIGKGSPYTTGATAKDFRGYIGTVIIWPNLLLTQAEHTELWKRATGQVSGDLLEYATTGILRGGIAQLPDVYLPMDQPRKPGRPLISVGV